jgi:hypothetical protein
MRDFYRVYAGQEGVNTFVGIILCKEKERMVVENPPA